MPRWTPQARLKQAAAIRGWMPWTLSTGPQTAEGKARCRRNAWKGGVRARVASMGMVLKRMKLAADDLFRRAKMNSSFRQKPALPRRAPGSVLGAGLPAWMADMGLDELDEDDDIEDAVDRMSSAEVAAAIQRLQESRTPVAGLPGMSFSGWSPRLVPVRP